MSGTTQRLVDYISSTLRQKEEVESRNSEGSSQMENDYYEGHSSRNSSRSYSPYSSHASSQERDMIGIGEILASFGSNSSQDFFKDARRYAERKQRSCQKRNSPITEEQKREESSRNSRNYTRRNREEIDFCRMKLDDEKQRLENSCREANEAFSPKYGLLLRSKIKTLDDIGRRLYENYDTIRRDLEIPDLGSYFDYHEKKKKEIHNVPYKPTVYTYEEEFSSLKLEYEALMDRKDEYIEEKGRTNFASAKSRLHQRVLRAELKRECYIMHCAAENMELKVMSLREVDAELKQHLWDVCVLKLDQLFAMKDYTDFAMKDYDDWLNIRDFFLKGMGTRLKPVKKEEPADDENAKEIEEEEEDSEMKLRRMVLVQEKARLKRGIEVSTERSGALVKMEAKEEASPSPSPPAPARAVAPTAAAPPSTAPPPPPPPQRVRRITRIVRRPVMLSPSPRRDDSSMVVASKRNNVVYQQLAPKPKRTLAAPAAAALQRRGFTAPKSYQDRDFEESGEFSRRSPEEMRKPQNPTENTEVETAPVKMVYFRRVLENGKVEITPKLLPASTYLVRADDGKIVVRYALNGRTKRCDTLSKALHPPKLRPGEIEKPNVSVIRVEEAIPPAFWTSPPPPNFPNFPSYPESEDSTRPPLSVVMRPVTRLPPTVTQLKQTQAVRNPIPVRSTAVDVTPRNGLLPVRRFFVRRIEKNPYTRPATVVNQQQHYLPQPRLRPGHPQVAAMMGNRMPVRPANAPMSGALMNPRYNNPKIRVGQALHDPNTISVGELLKAKLKDRQDPDALFHSLREQLLMPKAEESRVA